MVKKRGHLLIDKEILSMVDQGHLWIIVYSLILKKECQSLKAIVIFYENNENTDLFKF